MRLIRQYLLLTILAFLSGCADNSTFQSTESQNLFKLAENNGIIANEGFSRCLRFTNGWLALADSVTGLIPRNINDSLSMDIWNAKDCAADNYPFMVLTSAILDKELFMGKMAEMLKTETLLTSRLGSLPDTYSFSRKGFANNDTIFYDIIFGSAEYVKDGLIPLTEWLGPSPWSERMISIVDEVWNRAIVKTPYGSIVSDDPEINGDMLQSLSRIYWMTGDKRYLEYAIRLGDYYLLGDNHPTRNFKVLRLRDHGCEIVSGLCELYATLSFADPAKRDLYRGPVHEMLDRILETGRNEDGLFYNSIDPVKGVPVNSEIADNFGYTLNGFYTVYLLDKEERYRDAVIKANVILNEKYRNYAWEGTSSDGYADAIEGALNLYTREPLDETRQWIDSEIKVMWKKQQQSGIIEGWHGDGNFARTTIMYCLLKTQGTYMVPWNEGLNIGAVQSDRIIYLTLSSADDWEGKLMFDRKRHKEFMHLPIDWPRINQFPEYYTIEKSKNYQIQIENSRKPIVIKGEDLQGGFPLKMKKGEKIRIKIELV